MSAIDISRETLTMLATVQPPSLLSGSALTLKVECWTYMCVPDSDPDDPEDLARDERLMRGFFDSVRSQDPNAEIVNVTLTEIAGGVVLLCPVSGVPIRWGDLTPKA